MVFFNDRKGKGRVDSGLRAAAGARPGQSAVFYLVRTHTCTDGSKKQMQKRESDLAYLLLLLSFFLYCFVLFCFKSSRVQCTHGARVISTMYRQEDGARRGAGSQRALQASWSCSCRGRFPDREVRPRLDVHEKRLKTKRIMWMGGVQCWRRARIIAWSPPPPFRVRVPAHADAFVRHRATTWQVCYL